MKRPIFVLIVIFIFLAGLPLFAAGDAAAGKEAYTKKCASCHGPDGLGKDQIAQMMKIKFTPLGAKEVQTKSDADLKKIAIEGGGKMKAVKDVDDKMAEDIVAFLRTFAKK
jgi:mono/diheme cytochrome c family protein